jgi:hypothetical protein
MFLTTALIVKAAKINKRRNYPTHETYYAAEQKTHKHRKTVYASPKK